jgi:hypothetical protein
VLGVTVLKSVLFGDWWPVLEHQFVEQQQLALELDLSFGSHHLELLERDSKEKFEQHVM